MRFDLPECNRCFMCIPLRYGIIIFGYLNLLFALLGISLETVWMLERGNGTADIASSSIGTYKGVSFYAQAWLLLLLYAVEVVFNVILLVGAHTKRIKLLRVYYYYCLTTLLASFVTFIWVELRYIAEYLDYLELCITFLGLGSQAYLLLLIRTELMKRRYEGVANHECVNQLNSHHPPSWDPEVL